MQAGEDLVGTFLKTPAPELIEVLLLAPLDFIALDCEHAPFDRGRMDACLAMEMVSRPDERRFYGELLSLLGAPQAPRADIAQMEQATMRIMKAIGVQVLVIDEVHNILAGTYREQRILLNMLRFLSNRLQISLVCFGVSDARDAIGGDVQLARRFEQLP